MPRSRFSPLAGRSTIPGKHRNGRQDFARLCAQCHGKGGGGGNGPAIGRDGFLKQVSDGFIIAMMMSGRDGTEMRKFGRGGLTGRLPFNIGLSDEKHRNWMNDVWKLPAKRLEVVNKAKNAGMMVGLFERALKGDVKAMFYMYTTHIHQPDLNNLIRPGLRKMFVVAQDIYRHAPNVLYADVIFPALTWGEWQGGTYISSERRFNVVDGVGKGAPGLENCVPDLDMAVDKGKRLANLIGLDGDKIFPYRKKKFHPQGPELYDAEEILEEIVRGSKGTDCDLTRMLEVRERDGIGLYDQIRRLRGIQ